MLCLVSLETLYGQIGLTITGLKGRLMSHPVKVPGCVWFPLKFYMYRLRLDRPDTRDTVYKQDA